LVDRGLRVELVRPSHFRGLRSERAHVVDLLVQEAVIVEVKCVPRIAPLHVDRLLTYLRVTNRRMGLIINFNARLLQDGVERVINTHVDRNGQ
jgi:GxxExxY protein